MSTEPLFHRDAYAQSAMARVLHASREGVVLDRTVFYPRGGGQPGDIGHLHWPGGAMPVIDTIKGPQQTIIHLPAADAPLPPVGTEVHAEINWERRYRLMRMHTALHLLCALLPAVGVTGGQIGEDKSRLDFDLTTPPERDALDRGLAALIAADHPVVAEWVEEEELDTNPQLVRTLLVRPPRGSGRVRLIRIGAGEPPIDCQPCGGTHVQRTGEIGRIVVAKIESKGRANRRVSLAFAEE